ncbi:MAG TPA: DUF3570 domain-containing protein [Kofleriaceae bacterium]|nr:DUF3570 domain-containing protein [Kofleriaceae bacterium]
MLALAVPRARADGELAVRGVYYKEQATRVMQPMLDGMFDAGLHGVATGHFLVDAITSASASSGAANAQPFTERRYEGGLGYAHDFGGLTVGADAKYSTESDYISRYAGVKVQLELGQKNTVLGLGGGISLDTVSAAAAQGPSMPSLRCSASDPSETSCPLDVYALYGSASQILGPNTVLGGSVDLATLRGYQSNPYREAIAGDALVPERHPTERTRESFAASVRHYLSPTGTTVIAAYRYYRDTWKVHAHTPELRVVQEIGRDADATVGYRYYTQDGAFFFRDRYPADDAAMTQYVSDDVKLSTFTGHTLEAKLGVLGDAFELHGQWAAARFEGILEYDIQNNRFGNAVVAHVALTLPFTY